MMPNHKNPTKMRRHVLDKEKNDYIDVKARAPYNFVPLPGKMVETRLPLPSMGVYENNTFTGWIEFDIETCSPTYIRGMMTKEEYDAFGQKSSDELTDEEKDLRAPFFSLEKANKGIPTPAIPGSSLRGMLRSIIEVAGYGRMRWVAASPTFTYRSVAAEAHDPLKTPYRNVMGGNAANVRVGYLEKDKDHWYIRPAMTPKDCDVKAGRAEKFFLKVDDEDIHPEDVPGFVKMASEKYQPQIHPVWFKAGPRVKKRPEVLRKAKGKFKPDRPSWVVKGRMIDGFKRGTLVCSGNMRETGDASQDSPRARHYIVMPPNTRANRLPIPKQVIEDYRAGLTPYQKENLGAWAGGEWGCLGNGKPVFYVADNADSPKEIRCFGHSPNFRIPAFLFGDTRASTPLDFVPDHLRLNPNPDIADGIFGWVEEEGWGPEGQQAGRVFFEDAHLVDPGNKDLWLSNKPVTPKVLASPKSTTIQHYLVQDADKKHNPDDRVALAHYGTSPDETTIRGHKFYWHKGENPEILASPDEVAQHPKQYTKIAPLKKGVRFHSRIRFESLRSEELGGLIWALQLPGQSQSGYRHKIGMGKPLGMGAVLISSINVQESKLHEAGGRYQSLLDESKTSWYLPSRLLDVSAHTQAFESFMLSNIASKKQHLFEDDRIKAMLTMLEWHGETPDKEWLELTRYMEIEHQEQHHGKEISYNEYKSRPVLPNPFGVWTKLGPSQSDPEPRQDDRPQNTTVQNAPGAKKTGVVKWYRQGDYGYHGYITPDGGGDEVHFDEKQLKDKSRPPRPGQKVRFSIQISKSGKPNARDVEIL